MNFKTFISLVGIIAFILVGCTKVEDEIVGTWTFHNFEIPNSPNITWTFYEDGDLVRIMEAETGTFYDSSTYVVEETSFKQQIRVSGSNMLPGRPDINGLFDVEEFKDNILILTRIRLGNDETAGAYLRCEFTRN